MKVSPELLLFPSVHGKEVAAGFDGGDITSDCGALLVARADDKIGLTWAMGEQIVDSRQSSKVRHSVGSLLRQRVVAIACGYEDANDFSTLACDPAMKLACGRAPKSDGDLGSQPTVSRFENRVSKKDVASMGYAIARSVVSQLPAKTRQLIVDIDAYEDPCHGQQEFEFFNGYYNSHCYVPLALYVTGPDGVQRLIGAILRSGKGGSAGVESAIEIAVGAIRERFPAAKIILRADSAFGNADMLWLCDRLRLSYALGLASNERLQALSVRTQMQVCWLYTFGKARWDQPEGCRVFGGFDYKAGTWEHARRVIVKAEITNGELNPRFIVSNLPFPAQKAYGFYCGRGDIENRIKEFKLDLYAGRTSCHRFVANQFRLLLHVAASVLMTAIQEAAKSTTLARAQAGTIRLRLLKLGARVVETTRRVWVQMSSSFTNQAVWAGVYAALGP
jgi:hypothetical protein